MPNTINQMLFPTGATHLSEGQTRLAERTEQTTETSQISAPTEKGPKMEPRGEVEERKQEQPEMAQTRERNNKTERVQRGP